MRWNGKPQRSGQSTDPGRGYEFSEELTGCPHGTRNRGSDGGNGRRGQGVERGGQRARWRRSLPPDLKTVGEFLGSARAVADGIKMAAAEIEDAAVALLVVAPGEVDSLCL